MGEGCYIYADILRDLPTWFGYISLYALQRHPVTARPSGVIKESVQVKIMLWSRIIYFQLQLWAMFINPLYIPPKINKV